MKRLTVPKVKEMIAKYRGNVSMVARVFEVSRTAVQNYVNRNGLEQYLLEARESMKDNVISRFYTDCLKDDPTYQTSRIFFLKTLGRDRGFEERSELTGPGGGAIPIDLKALTNEQLIAIQKILLGSGNQNTNAGTNPE